MTREEIIATIREIAPRLRSEFGVASIGIFGSVARGDDRPGSDVDVVVTFLPTTNASLTTLCRVQEALEAVLSRNVDLLEDHQGLRPLFRRFLHEDMIHVA